MSLRKTKALWVEVTSFLVSRPCPYDLLNQDNGKESKDSSKNSKDSGISYERTVNRRFLFMFFSLLVDFGLGLWGIYCLNNERRLLGAALIGFGWLLLIGSLYLW